MSSSPSRKTLAGRRLAVAVSTLAAVAVLTVAAPVAAATTAPSSAAASSALVSTSAHVFGSPFLPPPPGTFFCGGRAATVVLSLGQTPTQGNDVIYGTNGAEVINGFGGNDVICGLGGDDIIVGGAGNDIVYGNAGNDVLAGNSGADLLVGGPGNDTQRGGAGNDRLYGVTGADILRGEDGEDILWGMAGPDKLFGGRGNDWIAGFSGADELLGEEGNDKLFGGTGNDWLSGGDGDDYLSGGAQEDTVAGGTGDDKLFGNTGLDTLAGGSGNDALDGGAQNDKMFGGPGIDTCLGGEGVDTADVFCESNGLPGEGQFVEMSRANWSSGYIQAQIVHDALEELGYTVSSPDDLEFAPDLAYQYIADGTIDLWANSWYPGHLFWWDQVTTQGNSVGATLTRVEGPMMPAGGAQGFLVTKAWADSNGVTTLDQINANPALWSQLDSDGNGKGEIYGCPVDWTCDDIIDSQLAFANWNNLEQVTAGYDAMFAEFFNKAVTGQAAIIYTWTPTSYLAHADPGNLTMWLSMNDASVLDASNPLGRPGGDLYSQRRGSQIGYKGFGADVCLQGPDGCQIGWLAADVEITANTNWLTANPAAAAMLEAVELSAFEMSVASVELANSNGSQVDVENIAANWIAANRGRVNQWVAAGMAAG